MNPLSDEAVGRLRSIVSTGDLDTGRYRILRELSRGGMGTVFVAFDELLDREVALKIVNAEIDDEETRKRIEREARIIAGLEHPSIVPVHDVGRLADGRFFYVMKLVRGRRLDHALESIGLAERLNVFLRVCDAVAFAHANGVIHRDLKPSNIMVGAFGEVLVVDWGIARGRDVPAVHAAVAGMEDPESGVTGEGRALGTPGFMAPEQQAGRRDRIDHRADVYSLGMTLREIVSGIETLRRRRGRVLEAIAAKASQPEPSDRYDTVTALAEDIRNFREELPVKAYPASWVERLEGWASRNRAAIAVIAAYMVMRLVIFAIAR